MGKEGKGVRFCLLFVVLVAILLGVIYFYTDFENQTLHEEGTLVSNIGNEWCCIWE